MVSNLSIYRRLAIASLKEYLRDPLPTLFSFVVPLFFIFSFGITASIVNSSGSEFKLKVAVIGEGPSLDRAAQALQAQAGIEVSRLPQADATALLQSGQAQAVALAAPGGGYSIVTTQSFQGMGSIVARLARLEAPAAKVAVASVADKRFDYFSFLFPSIVALALLQMALFGTATPIVSAKERGVFRYYAVVPMPRLTLLCAQVTVRLLFALLQVALLLAVGMLFFDVSIGQPLLLIGVVVLGALLLVSFGYALAGLFRSTTVATAGLMLLNFYCMLFGQLFVDMSRMGGLKWLVLTTPVGFVSDALRQAISGQAGMFSMTGNLAGMALWLAVSVFVGVRHFQFQPQVR